MGPVEQWGIGDRVIPVLGALKCVTTVMQDVSISNTYPIALGRIHQLMCKEGNGPKVIEFKMKVQSSLSNRMNVSYT